ncbi:cyclopropane fatty acid synthase [Mycena filopes]|nr:cyclopropane fatty acid synthase [Mycena filopes]
MDRLTLRSQFLTAQSNTFFVRKFLQYGLFTSLPPRRQLRALRRVARSVSFRALCRGLTRGQLIITDTEGTHVFGTLPESGSESPSQAVSMTVTNDALWGQLFLSHDLGLGEPYMQGHFEVSDLKGLLNLWLDNRVGLAGLSSSLSVLFEFTSSILSNTILRQNLSMARRSAEISYDISNAFMECFLGKTMMYSAALWSDAEHGLRGDLTHAPTDTDLEHAQRRKIRYFLKKARLQRGDRILEIGSGWGEMAIAAGRMGCFVDAITLSREQKIEADQRISDAGLSDCVQVHLCDYRELPPSFGKRFDACISCEMLEVVGYKNYGAYFKTISWALKADRATMVISSATQPEHRYSEHQAEDFIRRYHWPNGFTPSPTSLVAAAQVAVPGKLVLCSVEDHGIHYCRTLREWSRRFCRNFSGQVLDQMKERYPFLRDAHNLDMFKRKWLYMFVYAEVGFARAYMSLHHFVFTRPVSFLTVTTS